MVDEERYRAALRQMRQARATAIAADRSWLTLAGLYWLQQGENSIGVAAENTIVLPQSAGVARAGSFFLADGEVSIQTMPESTLHVNGNAVTEQRLQDDMRGAPDLITLGELSMIVIRRGDRLGIRLYDNASPLRRAFTDLAWYPIDPIYRIEARFVPYDPPKVISYGNVLGDMLTEESPGAIEFTWQGENCRLDALPRGEKLFFNFRDGTNGESTYGAGRFLYTDGPSDGPSDGEGTVVVDFNLATNPYCAYTAYATCPLPPPQNRLPVRIEAGERRFPLPLTV